MKFRRIIHLLMLTCLVTWGTNAHAGWLWFGKHKTTPSAVNHSFAPETLTEADAAQPTQIETPVSSTPVTEETSLLKLEMPEPAFKAELKLSLDTTVSETSGESAPAETISAVSNAVVAADAPALIVTNVTPILETPQAPVEAHADLPKTPVQSSHETNAEQPLVDIALETSREVLASTNLFPDAGSLASASKPFQQQLVEARAERRLKNFPAAETKLIAVLEAGAPEDIQRSALLELASVARDCGQLPRAQQIYSQYLKVFPQDPGVPEVLLRQGLLFREMGANTLALSKFYSVMSTALSLKLDQFDYYKRLVLQAQTEIADTYYLQGDFDDAAEYFKRLLKLENADLNKAQILYKLIRVESALENKSGVVAQAGNFATNYPDSSELPEVRFLLADALQKLGRSRESVAQVQALLQSQEPVPGKRSDQWLYWQKRAGNDIANRLYRDGDHMNALTIYTSLAKLSDNAEWQIPVWYQMGLVYERLGQPQKATETYIQILSRESKVNTNEPNLNLSTILDMARWRREHLDWQEKTGSASHILSSIKASKPSQP